MVGDGSWRIWNLAGEMFPGALVIVDLFHAKERLWEVAEALFGTDAELVAIWAEARCANLEADRLEELLTALGALEGVCEEAGHCARHEDRNRERIRYAEFRAAGLCVGAGVVETGCKTAMGTQLKRAGMHWKVTGANAVIRLRCCKLGGRYEDFRDERAQPTVW